VGLQNSGVIILSMSGSKQTIGYSVMGTGTVYWSPRLRFDSLLISKHNYIHEKQLYHRS
jgi:hypothetical protein